MNNQLYPLYDSDNPRDRYIKIRDNFNILYCLIGSGSTVNGNYLPLSGGTVTGGIYANAVSANTIFSGSTDLSSLFVSIGSEAILPIGIAYWSGGTFTGAVSGTSISANTIFSGSTDLSNLFSTPSYVGNNFLSLSGNSLTAPITGNVFINNDTNINWGTEGLNAIYADDSQMSFEAINFNFAAFNPDTGNLSLLEIYADNGIQFDFFGDGIDGQFIISTGGIDMFHSTGGFTLQAQTGNIFTNGEFVISTSTGDTVINSAGNLTTTANQFTFDTNNGQGHFLLTDSSLNIAVNNGGSGNIFINGNLDISTNENIQLNAPNILTINAGDLNINLGGGDLNLTANDYIVNIAQQFNLNVGNQFNIDAANINLDSSTGDISISATQDLQLDANANITMNAVGSLSIGANSGATYSDGNNNPINYFADYSANYTDRSLVDYGTVQNLIAISSGSTTYVQPGINIITGGTISNPIISVVSSPVFSSITASTVYSGSTDLSNIFAPIGYELNVTNQLNTKTNLSGATFTGAVSGTSISASTLFSGSTDLSNLFLSQNNFNNYSAKTVSQLNTKANLSASTLSASSINVDSINSLTTNSIQFNTPVGINLSGSTAQLTIKPNGTSTVGQIIKANTGQISDLLQIQDTNSNILSRIDKGGNFSCQNYFSTGSTPTISAGAGAGTLPTISISGNNIGGFVTIATGTAPGVSSTIATITFSSSWTFQNGSSIILFPRNPSSALLTGVNMVYASGTTSNWTINSGPTGLGSATTYIFNYKIEGF